MVNELNIPFNVKFYEAVAELKLHADIANMTYEKANLAAELYKSQLANENVDGSIVDNVVVLYERLHRYCGENVPECPKKDVAIAEFEEHLKDTFGEEYKITLVF